MTTKYTFIPHTGERKEEIPFQVGAEAHMLATFLVEAGKRNISLVDHGFQYAQIRVGKSLIINIAKDKEGNLFHQIKKARSGKEWFTSQDMENTIKNITGKDLKNITK